jgi:hypothetical protein
VINLKRFGSLQWFGVLSIGSFIGTCLMAGFSDIPPPTIVLVSNGILAGACLIIIDWRGPTAGDVARDSRAGMPMSENPHWDGLAKELITLVSCRIDLDTSTLTQAKVLELMTQVEVAQQHDYPKFSHLNKNVFASARKLALHFLEELAYNPMLESADKHRRGKTGCDK